jgi:hypothetical protein
MTGCTMGTASIDEEDHGKRSAPSLCAVPPTRLRMESTQDDVKRRCACGCWGMTRGRMRLRVLCTGTGLARDPWCQAARATPAGSQRRPTSPWPQKRRRRRRGIAGRSLAREGTISRVGLPTLWQLPRCTWSASASTEQPSLIVLLATIALSFPLAQQRQDRLQALEPRKWQAAERGGIQAWLERMIRSIVLTYSI